MLWNETENCNAVNELTGPQPTEHIRSAALKMSRVICLFNQHCLYWVFERGSVIHCGWPLFVFQYPAPPSPVNWPLFFTQSVVGNLGQSELVDDFHLLCDVPFPNRTYSDSHGECCMILSSGGFASLLQMWEMWSNLMYHGNKIESNRIGSWSKCMFFCRQFYSDWH